MRAMRRRNFLVGGLGALAACTETPETGPAVVSDERHRWRMVTSWPPNFPGHGTSANRLARRLGELSGGRLEVEVFSAGELVPAFEVLDAVSRGTVQLGHSAPIYWRGSIPAAQLFGSVPFGMFADQFNAWLYFGGGLELWREAYAGHDVIPFPAGNTGAQMGGWFNREINSLADLNGLKMRIPGLGGEVMKRAGALPVNLPGSEIFTALQTGAIDATEWVGPYNDTAFGLHQAATYYYHPGWQEPSGAIECFVSGAAHDSLSTELKQIFEIACMAENDYLRSGCRSSIRGTTRRSTPWSKNTGGVQYAEPHVAQHPGRRTWRATAAIPRRRPRRAAWLQCRGGRGTGGVGSHERTGLCILPGVRRRSGCLA